MIPKRIHSHPLVHQNRDCLALRRGPFIYALESIDQGRQLSDLRLARITENAPLETYPLSICERQIVGIKTMGTVVAPPSTAAAAGASDVIQDVREESVELKFVPYFAWGNRGPSDMRVWIAKCT
jgi:uncharacterized protein